MKDHEYKALISQSKRSEKIIVKATILQFINIYITIDIQDISMYQNLLTHD
jgi:hypothetical protein